MVTSSALSHSTSAKTPAKTSTQGAHSSQVIVCDDFGLGHCVRCFNRSSRAMNRVFAARLCSTAFAVGVCAVDIGSAAWTHQWCSARTPELSGSSADQHPPEIPQANLTALPFALAPSAVVFSRGLLLCFNPNPCVPYCLSLRSRWALPRATALRIWQVSLPMLLARGR